MPQNIAQRREPYNLGITTVAGDLVEVATAIETIAPGAVLAVSGGPDKKPFHTGWRDGAVSMRDTLGTILAKAHDERQPLPMIGVCTGARSRLLVVDVDLKERAAHLHDKVRENVEAMFGPPGRVAVTPSGSEHWFYRWSGEGNANLRDSHGLPVDVKGEGGFVVAAPSWRAGSQYRWRDFEDAAAGWLAVLQDDDLPTIRAGGVDGWPRVQTVERDHDDNDGASISVHAVPDGASRNEAMRDQLMSLASGGMEEAALIEVGISIARDLTARYPKDHPVKESEVRSCVRWIMGLRRDGRLRAKGCGAWAMVDGSLSEGPISDEAFRLWHYVETKHGAQPARPIILDRRAMRKHDNISGWSERKYRKGIGDLVRMGVLERIYLGRGKGDPNRYRLMRLMRNGMPDAGFQGTNVRRSDRDGPRSDREGFAA